MAISHRTRCHHKSWPRHTKGLSEWLFPLKFRSYGARDILNNTVKHFKQQDHYLTGKQVRARAEFVNLLLAQRPSGTPDKALLCRFAELLDQFFFHGSMMGHNNLIRINSGPLVTGYGYYLGLTFPHQQGSDFRADISINTHATRDVLDNLNHPRHGPPIHRGSGGDADALYPLALVCILNTLAHEMCHAYLTIFACTKDHCGRDLPNTQGVTGHGRVWLSLHATVVGELRTWHPAMSRMNKDLPKLHAKVESDCFQAIPDSERKKHYFPLRRENARQLISIDDSGTEVVVSARLIRDGEDEFERAFSTAGSTTAFGTLARDRLEEVQAKSKNRKRKRKYIEEEEDDDDDDE